MRADAMAMRRGPLLLGALALLGALGAATPGPTAQALDDTPWRQPEAPPRCTTAQAESGNVAGCLVAFYYDPAASGWGTPPAPGKGEGWEWNGYTYSGSPALQKWESKYIAENTTTVAGLAPGIVETHVYAQPLFEGFLNEISAKGYRVRDIGGYSFRCTAGDGWKCPSGDPSLLSNHAWGLAIDFNSSTNPIKTYTGTNGTTACQTPIETDIPKWVVETAEKWGLYWGGYGWSAGCPTTTTERSSVYRDPPHFEFRGTPAQAAAIAAFNYGNDPNAFCRKVVDEAGKDVTRCNYTGRPDATWRIPVQLDPPEGATAALINLTATDGAALGYLTLEDCRPRKAGERTTSALSFAPGESIATMAIVPLDKGRFCVYRSAAVHSIVDVAGYITAEGEPMWLETMTPRRLTDTRLNGTCRPTGECQQGHVPGESEHVVPTSDEATRIVNLTVVDGRRPGWLQTGACGELGQSNVFSNLNYMDQWPRANLAMMGAGDDGSCVFSLTQSHVIVDELARLQPDEGYGWQLGPARRILDTRRCTDDWCNGRPGALRVVRFDVGADVPAAAIAVTVTETQGPGYVTVGDCDDLKGRSEMATSNLNYRAGQIVTNLALVELEHGTACAVTTASAHIVIDVQAELVDGGELGLMPIEPERFHDSRQRDR